MTLVGGSFRYFGFTALTEHEGRANHHILQLINKSIAPEHKDFIRAAANMNGSELAQSAENEHLRMDIKNLISDLNIINIKIYTTDGNSIFSSATKKVGEPIERSKNFIKAATGMSASELVDVDHLIAFDGNQVSGSIISSYLPINFDGSEADRTVVEIQSNVTVLTEAIIASQWKILLATAITLGFINFFLFFIIKYADILRFDQEEKLQKNIEKMDSLQIKDSLTGLPNRTVLVDRMKQAIARTSWHNRFIAVVSINLDHFSALNETYGRKTGDAVLEKIAKRLNKSMRDGDTAARNEKDKFILFLNDMANPADITFVAEKILKQIRQPVEVSGTSINTTASLGIAIFPTDGKDPNNVLNKADEAMYIAKADGRDRYCHYSITDELMNKSGQAKKA